MTEDLGGVRPGLSRAATDRTVAPPTDIDRARRMAAYRRREHPKYVRALDRHIEHVYGPEMARAYGIRRWAA